MSDCFLQCTFFFFSSFFFSMNNRLPCVVVIAIVVAIACSCDALYHLVYKDPDWCDYTAKITSFSDTDPDHYDIEINFVHGDFFSSVTSTYNTQGKRTFIDFTLYRPDLAGTGHEARRFLVFPVVAHFACYEALVDYIPDHRKNIDEYFQYREYANFRGIKCFKYYNNSSYIAYGDDTTNAYYGYRTVNGTKAYDFIISTGPASSSPDQFAYDLKNFTFALCPKPAGTAPDQKVWDATCSKWF